MKKFLGLFLIAALGTALMTGCAPSDKTEEGAAPAATSGAAGAAKPEES